MRAEVGPPRFTNWKKLYKPVICSENDPNDKTNQIVSIDFRLFTFCFKFKKQGKIFLYLLGLLLLLDLFCVFFVGINKETEFIFNTHAYEFNIVAYCAVIYCLYRYKQLYDPMHKLFRKIHKTHALDAILIKFIPMLSILWSVVVFFYLLIGFIRHYNGFDVFLCTFLTAICLGLVLLAQTVWYSFCSNCFNYKYSTSE
jgi:hypothetical protein